MPTAKASADPLDLQMVRDLAEVLDQTGLTEIEIDRNGTRIRVARHPATSGANVASVPAGVVAKPSATATEGDVARAGEVVRSPMVGTVYFQAQPGAEPFARVGDLVAEGQTLLLVEAMKTMNPITAPRSARIVEFLVSDSQPVEYGEPLVVLE